MSGDLPAVSAKKLIGVLERIGWEFKRSKGSHHIFRHNDSPEAIVVPVHRGDLKTGLLLRILAQAELTREEFQELL